VQRRVQRAETGARTYRREPTACHVDVGQPGDVDEDALGRRPTSKAVSSAADGDSAALVPNDTDGHDHVLLGPAQQDHAR